MTLPSVMVLMAKTHLGCKMSLVLLVRLLHLLQLHVIL
jgi:hypothetical protein